jgi:hypothetical protein
MFRDQFLSPEVYVIHRGLVKGGEGGKGRGGHDGRGVGCRSHSAEEFSARKREKEEGEGKGKTYAACVDKEGKLKKTLVEKTKRKLSVCFYTAYLLALFPPLQEKDLLG